MDASQLTNTLRKQAGDFLGTDHPERVWFHRDALNVIANLEAEPPSPGMVAHAKWAIDFYKTVLERHQ